MNQSVNDRGVCRTAPATPGLVTKRKKRIRVEKQYINLMSIVRVPS